MLPSEVIKHIFTFVPGNEHIILSKICNYWTTILNEIPLDLNNIHQNSYQLYQNYITNGTSIIFSYKYTTSPYCLNLFMDCIHKHHFYFEDDMAHNIIDIWKHLFTNIIDEGHIYNSKFDIKNVQGTFLNSLDIHFIAAYLDAEYSYYVEHDGEYSYKRRYHNFYSELLTYCILYKHIYAKYLLLLKVKPCHFIKLKKQLKKYQSNKNYTNNIQ